MKPYPDIQLCDDEAYTKDHNPVDDEAQHHYGCECDLCLEFYRSLK